MPWKNIMQMRRCNLGARPLLLGLMASLLAATGAILVSQATYIHAKAHLAQILLERAFLASIETGRPVKPWSWADTWPAARIRAPRLDAEAIVLAGASGQALAFGPAHLERTPPPGNPGTTVYAAHRDTHFRFLEHLVPGDALEILDASGARHTYAVTHTSIVDWNASGIEPGAPGHNLVLATCWPFASRTPGPLRYLVHARPIPPTDTSRSRSSD
jgi:sortase A